MINSLSPEMLIGILPLVGISLRIKEQIRKQHPKYGEERIEVAHVQDEFLGGTGQRSNLVPLSLPEHLLDHVVKAERSEDWEVALKQYGAAHLIASRMTAQELEKANKLLAKHKK